MLRFLIDTQLPPRLTSFLQGHGYDAIHITTFPNGHLLHDADIRRIAVEEGRIIISKDADFHDYYILRGAPPHLLYLTLGNISNQELCTLFSQNLRAIEMAFVEHKADVVVMNRTHLIEY